MAAQGSPFSRAAQAFSRLNERERRLVLLTAGVAVVVILVIGSTLVGNALESRQKRVSMRRDEIAQLEALREKYQEAVAAEERSKKRITSNTTSLFSLLQKATTEIGLPVTGLNENRNNVKDVPDVFEVSADLNIKEISVDKLNTLLEKIEGKRSDGVVKVTKLKVKTRFDNPEMLEVSMTVATWKGTGSAGAASDSKTESNP